MIFQRSASVKDEMAMIDFNLGDRPQQLIHSMSKSIPTTLFCSIILLSIGCGAPQEARRRVSAERSPLLPEPEDDERPIATLHAGDLVEVVPGHPLTLDWKGPLDGPLAERHGELLTVRRANGFATGFVFASDLGETVKVPASAWLCKRMGGPPECAERLHRSLRGDLLLAWDPCSVGACSVAAVRNRQVATVAIEGLSDLTPATIDGQEVLLATTRWVKGPAWTGATTWVYRVGDTLKPALHVETEELDARHPPAVHRLGTLAVENGVLTFRGSRREIAPSDGAVIATRTLVETYRLAK
jgi:hypothetical protein